MCTVRPGDCRDLKQWPGPGHNSGIIVSAVSQIIFSLTQSQLLPGVRGQREAQHRHGGDQEARHDQVEEVVHRPPPDLDCVGDVQIRLRTTIVNDLISFCRNTLIKHIKIMENSFSYILSFNTRSIPRCFHLRILLQNMEC